MRKRGQDNLALPLFQKAYELAGTPRTAAQLGLVEMQLGYRLEAETHLSEALAARNEFWIEKYRTVLDDSLRKVRAGIGEIAITGTPAGAEIAINGHRRGQLPLMIPLRVVAGPATIQLHAEGYSDGSASITVRAGEQERVSINLARLPVAQTTKPDVAQVQSNAAPSVLPKHNPSAAGWGTRKIIGVTLAGAGILALASGGALLLYDNHQSCSSPLSGAECDERINTKVPGWSLTAAGVGATTIGCFLFFTVPARSEVALDISPSSIAVRGRF